MQKRSDYGFTLIEVVVAVTILSTGIIYLLGAVNGGLKNFEIAISRSKMATLASVKMDEYKLFRKDKEFEREGSFREPYEGYGFRFEEFAVEIDEIEIRDLIRVVLTINWGKPNREEDTIVWYRASDEDDKKLFHKEK
jgi:prepilin-type N-terminal cleavage/methylation domain-containing protein